MRTIRVKKLFDLPVVQVSSAWDVENIAAMLIKAAKQEGCLSAECEHDGVTLRATADSTVESIADDYAYQKGRKIAASVRSNFKARLERLSAHSR